MATKNGGQAPQAPQAPQALQALTPAPVEKYSEPVTPPPPLNPGPDLNQNEYHIPWIGRVQKRTVVIVLVMLVMLALLITILVVGLSQDPPPAASGKICSKPEKWINVTGKKDKKYPNKPDQPFIPECKDKKLGKKKEYKGLEYICNNGTLTIKDKPKNVDKDTDPCKPAPCSKPGGWENVKDKEYTHGKNNINIRCKDKLVKKGAYKDLKYKCDNGTLKIDGNTKGKKVDADTDPCEVSAKVSTQKVSAQKVSICGPKGGKTFRNNFKENTPVPPGQNKDTFCFKNIKCDNPGKKPFRDGFDANIPVPPGQNKDTYCFKTYCGIKGDKTFRRNDGNKMGERILVTQGVNKDTYCFEGFENYVPQPVKDVFDWIAGRPDINDKSKVSLLPGFEF
jgi:hypothetical protein